MKRICMRILAAMITVGMLASCRLIPKIVLYNHTGVDITVHQGNRNYPIANEKTLSFRFPGAYTNVMTITAADKMWTYSRLPYPPAEFCQPLGHERIKVQIETDGMLYVLPHTNQFPLIELSGQPEGFPLKPETKPNTTPGPLVAKRAKGSV